MATLSPGVADRAMSLLVEGLLVTQSGQHSVGQPVNQSVPEAEKLLLALRAFGDHVLRRVSYLQYLRAPIYRLPSELLTEIFLLNSEQWAPPEWHRIAISLTKVSSRWHSVVINEPRLWNCLYSGVDLKITKLMLERSKRAPLQVYVADGNPEGFLDLVIPHVSRWKYFLTQSSLPAKTVFKYLSNISIPNLKYLAISYELDPVTFDNSLNIVAPSLTGLVYGHCPFPLLVQSGPYSKLTELKFPGYIGKTPLLPEHYRLILTSAPYLETIDIRGDGELEVDSQPVTTLNIHLPKLRRLTLNSLPSPITGTLISSISTAPNSHPLVQVNTVHMSDQLESVFPTSPGSNSLSTVIFNSSWISLQIDDRSLFELFKVDTGIRRSNARKTLMETHMTGDTEIFWEIFSGWVATNSNLHLRSLELVGLGICSFGSLFSILSFVPQLENLRICSSEHDDEDKYIALDSTITAISSPADPDDDASWMCPRLKHITFNTTQLNIGVLMQLIQARTSDPEGEDGVLSGRPYRLECVEVSNRVLLREDPLWEEFELLLVKQHVEFRHCDTSDW